MARRLRAWVPFARATAVTAAAAIAEKNGTWGKAKRLPGSAALAANAETLSCGAPGNCSVGGSDPFVATEKNGTWGKAELVPGT